MEEVLICEFSNPVEMATGSFQYSKMNCSSSLVEKYTDGTSSFYFLNTATPGELFIMFLLAIFCLAGIVSFIQNFIHGRKNIS